MPEDHLYAVRFVIPLPRYQCHKVVGALKIAHVIQTPVGFELHFELQRYVPIAMSAAWTEKHNPERGGYLVSYDDGYLSYSPAQAFEAGYTLMD